MSTKLSDHDVNLAKLLKSDESEITDGVQARFNDFYTTNRDLLCLLNENDEKSESTDTSVFSSLVSNPVNNLTSNELNLTKYDETKYNKHKKVETIGADLKRLDGNFVPNFEKEIRMNNNIATGCNHKDHIVEMMINHNNSPSLVQNSSHSYMDKHFHNQESGEEKKRGKFANESKNFEDVNNKNPLLRSDKKEESLMFSLSLEQEDVGRVESYPEYRDHRDKSAKRTVRCHSEPLNYKPLEKRPIQVNSNFDRSPTLKLLFSKLAENVSSSKIHLNFRNIADSLQHSPEASSYISSGRITFEDLLGLFSLNKLTLKRSFSQTKLRFDRKYIKKSSSFEKFLKNIVKGKRKSVSLFRTNLNESCCSNNDPFLFNASLLQRKDSTTSTDGSYKDAATTESDNLEEMFMMIMNGSPGGKIVIFL